MEGAKGQLDSGAVPGNDTTTHTWRQPAGRLSIHPAPCIREGRTRGVTNTGPETTTYNFASEQATSSKGEGVPHEPLQRKPRYTHPAEGTLWGRV